MQLSGTIENISYEAQFLKQLPEYYLNEFNINIAKPAGRIIHKNGNIAYSKWVSPKRTRTYPFERIYNTINDTRKITIIPIIKDEGLDGDLDRIQFSTFSWMSLLGVFVVLGYYESAKKNRSPKQILRHKLTNQQFNTVLINEQINEILRHKLEAIHWNRSLIQNRFISILDRALESYQRISRKTKVKIHSQNNLAYFREAIINNLEEYKNISLRSSINASKRELLTNHRYEHLSDEGEKCPIILKNYLGGDYFLTVDEVYKERRTIILQESKNSTTQILPSLSDIKDGLFKLILYSNIHELQINGMKTDFTTRLKLTSPLIKDRLVLPAKDIALDNYFKSNAKRMKPSTMRTIRLLNKEVTENRNITVVIERSE